MSLGKGLGSLIPPKINNASIANQEEASEINKPNGREVLDLPVSQVKVNPQQPRQHMVHDELENLVQSIKEHGVLQPIIVTKTDEGYELVAGERRLRASKIAGNKTVPGIVREASDLEKLELALIENIQRSDLNPIEKAEGYSKLIDEFGLTQEQAGKKMGVSRSSFANTIRMLSLPDPIQKALGDRKISEGHAKVILSLAKESEQIKYFNDIINNKMSVRSLESAILDKKPKKKREVTDPQINYWTEKLQDKLKTKVNISKKGDKGKLQIEFYSASELSEIVKNIMS
ncbi:MAG: ParB/RepB/Spo0J family partition protein [Patescibacteria group bacterium]